MTNNDYATTCANLAIRYRMLEQIHYLSMIMGCVMPMDDPAWDADGKQAPRLAVVGSVEHELGAVCVVYDWDTSLLIPPRSERGVEK